MDNQENVTRDKEGADKKLLEDESYDSREVMENGTQGERDSDRTEGDSTGSREETTKLSLEDDVDDDVFTEENHDDVKKPRSKAITIALIIVRLILLLTILYFFICSLDLLSDGFKLIGGRAAGDIFANNPLLSNPLCGLMIGVVATAFLQSSSTSTSIVITMVAAGLLTVQLAIPIVMGANIGTSVTGIIVSVSQAGDRKAFRRAFAAATVHDMFNWLTVLVLLPVEVITGYLYRVTSAIVDATNMAEGQTEVKFLSVLIKPVTDLVVQIDDEVLEEIATGNPAAANMSLLKYWCKTESVPADHPGTPVYPHLEPAPEVDPTKIIGVKECVYIFHGTSMSEQLVGLLVLLMALFLLIFCLVLMVKVLKSLLQGSMAGVIQKTINADFPGRAACLTGYLAILVGAVVTILVQSSSVVASALTPLVGIGLVTVRRVFPMMLGANIGTTSTALLAAFATSGDKMVSAFQIALCHLFFNLTGILIWYPIPFMRRVPIKLARFLGRITSRYRWFAAMYILIMFFIAPLIVFALSIPGWYVLAAVGIPFILLVVTILIINLLQDKKPEWLPGFLRTWEFLPETLRSLEPLDRQVMKLMAVCSCCKCCTVIDKSLDKYEIGRRLSVFETVEDSIEDFRKFANITVAKDASVPIKVSPMANTNFESNV